MKGNTQDCKWEEQTKLVQQMMMMMMRVMSCDVKLMRRRLRRSGLRRLICWDGVVIEKEGRRLEV